MFGRAGGCRSHQRRTNVRRRCGVRCCAVPRCRQRQISRASAQIGRRLGNLRVPTGSTPLVVSQLVMSYKHPVMVTAAKVSNTFHRTVVLTCQQHECSTEPLHFQMINLTQLYVYCFIVTTLSFSALTLLVGRQEGHPACKRNWVMVCWR